MFDGLDDIDWSAMNSWGDSTLVPGLLRDVAIADGESAAEALDALHDVLRHQGEPSECAVYAVPFLVDLAVSESVRCRDGVLALLGNMALHTTFVEVFGLQWLDDWGFAEKGLGPAAAWLERGELWRRGLSTDQLDELCHLAVADERKRLVPLLDDDDAAVRIHTIGVLASLGNMASELLTALWARLGVERDDRVRAVLFEGITELGLCIVEEGKPDLAARLLRAAEREDGATACMVATTGAALIAPSRVPVAAHLRFEELWEQHGDTMPRARPRLWGHPLHELWGTWERAREAREPS